jgi:uncharacterized membrane protein YebE (DUF533 family)
MSDQLNQMFAPPDAATLAGLAPSHIFENIVIRFLARVIHADGTIDPKEMSMLVDISIQLGLGGPEAHRILDDELGRKSDVGILAQQIADTVQRREVYAMGCLMGMSDGSVGDTEKTVLAEYARGGGIPEKDAAEILEAVVAATSRKA